MMKRLQLLLALIILISWSGNAQERLVTKGNERYEEYSFSPAIDIYQRLLEKGFASSDILQKLGNSYYFNADYEKAAEAYKRLTDEYPEDVGPEVLFRYGQSLRSLGEYTEADEIMDKFAEATSEDGRAGKFMTEKDYRDQIERNSGRYDIAPFEFNSKYSEFAPTYYKSGLLFSSDRDTGNLARYRHTWNSKDFLDLYKVNVDSASSNTVIKLKNVNSRLHESTSVSTKDGDTIYFTRNNFKDGKYIKDDNGVIRLKIFRATLVDGEWGNLEDLPFNSDSYSVAHPALGPDGKTLYVASDMPGTRGASDIFKIPINADGTFGTPVNLGDTVNTEARETFPYVTSEEILYFSSDGHPGLGGLDVFATKIAENKYQRSVLNVGRPVNSKMDDFTFVFTEESRKGYFASNRRGGMGADDIYSFVESRPLVFECIQPITGTVRDKISNEVLVGATVKVIDENNEEVLSAITDDEGNYSLTCDCNQGNFVRAQTQGYVPAEEYLARSDGKPRIMDFYLEREKVTAGFGDDLAKLLQLSTIYFDFDRFNIRPDAEIEIQKVIAAMEKYPSLKIKANSHTDSRGEDAYNLWLSQKRAEATVNYMISKGIAADRLEGEGFGETRLVNECANGVKCSKVDHELNRRSEFIIIE
ncbi:OmpA family protein [Poritiphilus flavus]|uniref:OmpA family protein n=1 Tax=Poritiphilus flavus TaxID=2697053 RepID=A0A6L9EB75_9FLAO|nr:OmpA family protein [Poritiphilus flavus]NAS11821.1 OmpA family protein [Poritiphilus flavus]